MDPTIIFTSLIPLIIDGVKTAIGHFTDNKPAVVNAEDYSKVVDADIRKLDALYKIGQYNRADQYMGQQLKISATHYRCLFSPLCLDNGDLYPGTSR